MTPAKSAQRVNGEAEKLLKSTERLAGKICDALYPMEPGREPFILAALGYVLKKLQAETPEAAPAAQALETLALENLTVEPGRGCKETDPGGAVPEVLYRCRDGVRRICGAYRAAECDGFYTPDAEGCTTPNLGDWAGTQKAEYAAYKALGTVEQLAALIQEAKEP